MENNQLTLTASQPSLIFFYIDGELEKINKESFQTIYLGSQIQMEDAQSIREICKANYPHIKIYSMQLAGNQFKLLAT